MHHDRLLAGALAFIVAAGLSLSASAAADVYEAHGVVKSADPAAKTVTIEHDDIPGLMMGMTMTFSVSDPDVLRGVEPGQVVDFRVRQDEGGYVVTEIRPSPSSQREEAGENAGGTQTHSCCRSGMGCAMTM